MSEHWTRSAKFDIVRPMFAALRRRGIDIQSPTRRAALDPMAVHRRVFAGRHVEAILDCGGHHGRVAREYAAMFPHARVWTFEPTPATFAALKANVAGESRIEPVNAAVGERAGRAEFHLAAHEQANSLLPPEEKRDGAPTVSVEVVRIDEFCRGKGIERVQIVKLDIEGHELAALRGCGAMIDEQRIDLLYCETRFEGGAAGATTLPQLCEYLEPRGYEVFGLYDLRHGGDLQLQWCDVVFVSGGAMRGNKCQPSSL